MKILLTGAAGMLATDIIPQLENRNFKITPTDIIQRTSQITKLDFTNLKEVQEKFREVKPDMVFHLGALTDVDLCEKEPDLSYKVNYLGTENIVLNCGEYDIPLLYVSTGAVFDGKKNSPYTEFDTPNPSNYYADSKYRGELFIQQQLRKHYIVRAGWMIGGWNIDKKFVYKIVQQLMEGKTELKAVDDKFGTPCFTFDFAKQIMQIIETKRYGLYHCANNGIVSRHDIACKIVEIMNLNKEVHVQAVNSAQFPLPAPRSRSEALRNYKLDLLQMNNMPNWETSLRKYIVENTK